MDLNKKTRILEMLRKNIGKGKTITQELLASELGIDQGRISRIMNGHFKSDRGAVKQLYEYFDFDPEKVEPRSKPKVDRSLMDAIDRNWDGTVEHAQHLARIIDEIGEITRMKNKERY